MGSFFQDIGDWFVSTGASLKSQFILNFVEKDRYQYLTKGLLITLKVTFFAVILGIILGFLVAIIRSTHDKTGKCKLGNLLCRIYLTVVRGTPVVVQLMLIYFVVFASVRIDKSLVAIISFGLNSGAYVAEIIRGGIMSIDAGQTEAGRSLGLSFPKTMMYIIIPQTFKAVLPSLANEFIVLLKETSVCGFIGLNDLTRGGDIIKGITFSAFMPLIAVALIYLVMVIILSALVNKLERRLRKSDRG